MSAEESSSSSAVVGVPPKRLPSSLASPISQSNSPSLTPGAPPTPTQPGKTWRDVILLTPTTGTPSLNASTMLPSFDERRDGGEQPQQQEKEKDALPQQLLAMPSLSSFPKVVASTGHVLPKPYSEVLLCRGTNTATHSDLVTETTATPTSNNSRRDLPTAAATAASSSSDDVFFVKPAAAACPAAPTKLGSSSSDELSSADVSPSRLAQDSSHVEDNQACSSELSLSPGPMVFGGSGQLQLLYCAQSNASTSLDQRSDVVSCSGMTYDTASSWADESEDVWMEALARSQERKKEKPWRVVYTGRNTFQSASQPSHPGSLPSPAPARMGLKTRFEPLTKRK